MKTRVAMLFGGKSVEHEVSVISGIQAVMNMDTDKYEVIPVYMTKRNEMYIGEEIGKIESYKNIDELLKKSQRVIMTNEDGKVFLTPFPVKMFGGKKPVEIDVAFPVVHGTNVGGSPPRQRPHHRQQEHRPRRDPQPLRDFRRPSGYSGCHHPRYGRGRDEGHCGLHRRLHLAHDEKKDDISARVLALTKAFPLYQ